MHKLKPYINNTTNTAHSTTCMPRHRKSHSTNAAHLVIAIENGEIILAILRTLSFSASFHPRWYTLNLNGPNKTPQINASYNKEIDDCVESKCSNQPSSNTKLSWYHCSQPAVPGFLASLPMAFVTFVTSALSCRHQWFHRDVDIDVVMAGRIWFHAQTCVSSPWQKSQSHSIIVIH